MIETQTELEIFTALAVDFAEDKECEHRYHNDPTQARFHSGKAEWYTQVQCGTCGHTGCVRPVCDKWKRTAETGRVWCSKCGGIDATANFLVKERIK